MLAQPNMSIDKIERSNVHHLVMDIAWYGLALAATSRFLSVYAIRLGATPLDLGLITAIPSLVLLLSAATGSAWMRHFGNPSQALIIPGFVFRFIFLLPAFTPFVPVQWQPEWLIISVSLPALMQGASSTAFVMLMRSAVQDSSMSSILSKRSTAMNIAIAIGALCFGVWLESAPYPFNYQVMFVVAFAFALISYIHCLRVDWRVNERITHPPQRAENPTQNKVSVKDAWKAPRFRQVAIVVMITHISFFSIVAVTPLHLVEKFNASEGFMALFAMVELAGGAVVGLLAARVSSRIGTRPMIALAMLGTALAGVIYAITPSLVFALVGAALSGASWTAVAMIGLFAYFTENTPTEHTAVYSSAYHQVIGLASFIGPLIGSALATSGLNLVVVLLIGAALRLLAAPLLEYHLKDTIKEVGAASIHHLKLVSIRRKH